MSDGVGWYTGGNDAYILSVGHLDAISVPLMTKARCPIETRWPYLVEIGLAERSEVVGDTMMGGISHRPYDLRS
jgi:hypothetical protein